MENKMSYKTDIYENAMLIITAFVSTYHTHQFQFVGVKEFTKTLDFHVFMKESFVYPFFAFLFVKALDILIGERLKAFYRNIFTKLKGKFK